MSKVTTATVKAMIKVVTKELLNIFGIALVCLMVIAGIVHLALTQGKDKANEYLQKNAPEYTIQKVERWFWTDYQRVEVSENSGRLKLIKPNGNVEYKQAGPGSIFKTEVGTKVKYAPEISFDYKTKKEK